MLDCHLSLLTDNKETYQRLDGVGSEHKLLRLTVGFGRFYYNSLSSILYAWLAIQSSISKTELPQ